ncbi:hypothetical protein LCGC14_1068900 [marine sediment metagenome]|uniref:Uncharacterized protein n=1 Tax=marine sediment metagenome TaxID=412755 RepID=A0A0F9MIU4_9ZZZZ
MPKRHEREKLVTSAEIELQKAALEISKELTTAEYLRVLANVFGGAINSIAKYEIRQERHGNTETPGGWA